MQLAEAISKNTNATTPSAKLIADELHKLFDLLQKGAITQQEYEQQKAKLIST